MKFDDFMNALAHKARQEQVAGLSPRNTVLHRIGESQTDVTEEGQRPLFWIFIASGAAACLSVLASLDAYALLMDPLGLFISVLGYLPLEV